MKIIDAIKTLNHLQSKYSRCVYNKNDLRVMFPDESDASLAKSLDRLVDSGVLQRAIRGVFVYTDGASAAPHLLESIARTLRPFEHCYISLESALAEHGLISQVPLNYLSVMTAGRSGTYRTPYGTIEFTRTKRRNASIINRANLIQGRPLPIATRESALSDIRRVGRNINMIQEHADQNTYNAPLMG